MRRNLVFGLMVFASVVAHGQLEEKKEPSAIPAVRDSLYREDQFYVALSFNLIANQPDGFSQNGFSGGLHGGFMRDMPLNKRRNWAIALGMGISTNVYNSNLIIRDADRTPSYELFDDSRRDSNSNRFYTNLAELPLQIRWRTSTVEKTNFWRIYGGFKMSYLFHFRSRFKNDEEIVNNNDPIGLERWRYAATMSIGNGTFNAFIEYYLNPLFNDTAVVSNRALGLRPLKIGVVFYIL